MPHVSLTTSETKKMFENESAPNQLRRYTQEDLLASTVRVALAAAGPIGAIVGEFLTQFTPSQRLDRLQNFTERLAARLEGLEEQFKARLTSSQSFAVLAEEVSQAAVHSASDHTRDDLSALLAHGLSREDAELHEVQALLRLRERISDAQVLLLMSYGNFKRTLGDSELKAFFDAHPGLFDVEPPSMSSPPDVVRRWTMRQHYEAELVALGLLKEEERSGGRGSNPRRDISTLGRLLLDAIGRYHNPRT